MPARLEEADISTPKPLLALLTGLLALSACAAAGPAGQAENRLEQASGASTSATAMPAEWTKLVTPLRDDPRDLETIVAAARGARFVLLGESTHGTHEFYRERARISDRLVRELSFGAVAVEGDWSATARVNRYVRGLGLDKTAEQALAGFTNFPGWMWRNAEFRDFIEGLRSWNLGQPPQQRVGVYGMDVYDVFDAADAVIAYLARVSPPAAERARRHYRCFAPYRRSTHAYGEAARRASRSCREQAASVLAEVRSLPRPREPVEAEQHFAAIRSAASVAAGEEYFRTVYAGSLAWNVRDRQMARNVEEVAEHVAAQAGRPGKVIVWAHNSHVGDARATYAASRGEINLGQLMRQRHQDGALLVGLFTYAGQVLAAPEWDAPGRVYDVRPALPGSHSDLFHQLGRPAFSLVLRGSDHLVSGLGEPRLQRAIGVVYQPQTERHSHYFQARLSDQFDAILFFDRSRAVAPLR